MQKSRHYYLTRFSPEVIQEAYGTLKRRSGSAFKDSGTGFSVDVDNATWQHDSEDEFFSDYRRSNGSYTYRRAMHKGSDFFKITSLHVSGHYHDVSVSVAAADRGIIEAVFEVFERNVEVSKLPPPEPNPERPKEPASKPIIFIGHGHSQVWRNLKDHLHELHGYAVEAYETGSRAGHAIRDILEDMKGKSSFALLVLTADDQIDGDLFRARQNVIHETGLFQGYLGFSRAIVLLEDGVEVFSNIDGIQQIRFSPNNIRETFGDVLATIRREFGDEVAGEAQDDDSL